ncbi:2-hydroxy-3-keto-5-methylthiopentenyl-1-phosphate phosphatase [Sedimentibacter acidaminivorans]|uniref:2-hydroxy-3-keto-5-methylthiopentenyl-1-phosphate phosphatase n=1 Tax=Sedimentibacter acidaminivorans TaxID=913099 RepID=A0ABS4GC36_9FIRM|nr:HAD family hydrolase [Sedimentibacter acidaminivorans]MBP1925255.1 2-hydroxy-3-keto-5-methylthiopentenyl-1-phosphate phosphatase [Sedimentibacter acidaminivorans]
MEQKPIVAIMYDFDKTLSPRDMQEYAFIPGVGMEPENFWNICHKTMVDHNMDQILAYMLIMKQEAEGKMLLSRDEFRKLGKSVILFKGVKNWFKRINDYGEKLGVVVEHYIISSGLKEIIEGTDIAKEFKQIYAAEFCYNDKNVPIWPAMAVNYTSKTQFLFRINKGVLDVTEHRGLNEFTPENKRRIPFVNMVYIGDGLTDVPCMKLVKENGGHSIAVYQDKKDEVNNMIAQGRVDFVILADYSKNSAMENTVFAILDHISATSKTIALHIEHKNNAENDILEKQKQQWAEEHNCVREL